LDVSATTSLSAMAANRAAIVGHAFYPAIAVLVLLAAFTKSAQVPFHFWLPSAMAAPTPVSAYLHSATMVKAGVYLVARMTPVLGATPLWTTTVTVVGAVTMVVGAYRCVQETDLKRILAYSTLSALGVLMMLLGVGTPQAIVAALVYLVAHACYKGALFLVAGAIDHETGTRDITTLQGLRQAMPLTALAGGAAALSMAGVPLTLGFVGKDGAYEALMQGGSWGTWLLTLLVVSSILLGLAGLLAGVVPFRGTRPDPEAVHEPGWALWLPPLMLAACGVIVGVIPSVLDAPLSAAAAAILKGPSDVSLAIWHGLSPALMLSALTLAGVAVSYRARIAIRNRTWRARHGAEALYTWALAGLNSISALIAPPLHSASLRSYVMVIVLTSVVVGGTALVTSHTVGTLPPGLHVRPHEFLLVGVIIVAALAATFARSTMAAVLALGVVGYGVATIFLVFGAPDLAMTQFSVETLTVIIYVLVFRHFRNLGALSPRIVRYRDALIAAGAGTLIGSVVLTVSRSETAPRLREYFAEFGPTVGHGRNIVNVILVDFRAFDTMAEITVLATAAIGVRALLRLGVPESAGGGSIPMQNATSPIFRTATRLLMPLLLLFSIFLLLRGHNLPGGGFVGGLVAAAALSLYGLAFGFDRARRALRVTPMTLLGAGLAIALVSGVPAVLRGQPFLTALWAPGALAIGTPMIFDVGVFLVVWGVVLMMIFSLAEEP
jgi:multicomponent Na+:H+ antiporter subunit A